MSGRGGAAGGHEGAGADAAREAGAPARPPFVIGLLGGVASGKSFVGRLCAERGAAVVDADRLAHEALADPGVLAAIRAAFGDAALDGEGRLDKPALAARVFTDVDARRRLEAIVHPRVGQAIAERLGALARPAAAPRAVAVLDVPLLLEVGLDACCDALWLVDAAEPLRRTRVKARGWDSAELDRRERAQVPLAVKRARASAVVQNDGDEAATREQVAALWAAHVEPALAPA